MGGRPYYWRIDVTAQVVDQVFGDEQAWWAGGDRCSVAPSADHDLG